MSAPVCDFCTSSDVQWAFPCRTFQIVQTVGHLSSTHMMGGAWAACPACHALIMRGDRVKLARRAAKRSMKMIGPSPMSLNEAAAALRQLHDAFWSNREGAPERIRL